MIRELCMYFIDVERRAKVGPREEGGFDKAIEFGMTSPVQPTGHTMDHLNDTPEDPF